MRKELLWAVGAGSILGLLIAYGVWRANTALKQNIASDKTQVQQQDTESGHSADLSIISPNETSVSTSSTATIQGIAKPNSTIAMFAQNQDYLIFSDNTGNFSAEIELSGGINSILISQIDSSNSQSTKTLTIIYSSEIGQGPLATDQPEPSDSIRQRIQEKLEDVASKPTALLGVVTDKTESGLQIKLISGQIQQIFTSIDTTFARIAKTTKETDFADVGIGDHIAALGWESVNTGLDAGRILISDTPNTSDRRIFRGSVAEASSKSVILDSSDEAVISSSDRPIIYYLDNDKNIKKTNFTFFDEGDDIIALGELIEGKFVARTVFDLTLTPPTPKP